jgi:hypothetical protein
MGIKRAVEMAKLWDGEISSRTISAGFEKNWFYSKKKTYGYCERDEIKRQAFLVELSSIPSDQMCMLMNQLWITEINMIMLGITRGQRFHALKSGRRQGRSIR